MKSKFNISILIFLALACLFSLRVKPVDWLESSGSEITCTHATSKLFLVAPSLLENENAEWIKEHKDTPLDLRTDIGDFSRYFDGAPNNNLHLSHGASSRNLSYWGLHIEILSSSCHPPTA